MIFELSLISAIMLYLTATISTLLVLWGWQHMLSRKRKIDLNVDKLVICEYCHFPYLGKKSKSVSKCPGCNSYNK